MPAKYQVSKRTHPQSKKPTWAINCKECGHGQWANDWKHAIFLASYPCGLCELATTFFSLFDKTFDKA